MCLEIKFWPIVWVLHHFIWQLLSVTRLWVDALVVKELAKCMEELELLVFAMSSALVVNLVLGGKFARSGGLGLR